VLDLGCGVGHSIDLLAPRESVGVDRDAESLAGQPRETVAADMRSLPFGDESFASVVCSHAIEHVPDPERIVAEAARVLEPGGVAVFTTPNRLTFARADEIIDPYHHVELDPGQLRALCSLSFRSVGMYGVFGSERYEAFHAAELAKLDRLLRLDPLRLRRLVPRPVRQRLYDRRLSGERVDPPPEALAITIDDFRVASDGLERCLDLVAVCRAGQ
jgi:SAM-dependent methyltransferase